MEVFRREFDHYYHTEVERIQFVLLGNVNILTEEFRLSDLFYGYTVPLGVPSLLSFHQ